MKGRRLSRRFFEQPSPMVAEALLGKLLVRVEGGVRNSGVIVETEAYRGPNDPASHAFKGKTKRNEVMFGDPGHAYVYFSYGNHWCLNFTCEPAPFPAAVLIRAVEPVEGVGQMLTRRGVSTLDDVANGPGKLTKAMQIDGTFNGEDVVTSERLFVESGRKVAKVGRTSRVGISTGQKRRWRFFIAGNRFVSKGKPSESPETHN